MVRGHDRSRPTRRSAIRLIGGVALGALATACATPSAPATPTAGANRSGPSFDPVLANSELVVGRNRFAMGLIGEGNRPITDARVQFGFFQIHGQQATKMAEADAVFRWIEIQAKGMYVAPVEFSQAGSWGVEVAVTRPDRAAEIVRLPFEVKERGQAPMIGDPAPRGPGGSAGEPCTNAPPCELHAVGIDEAVGGGRPLVALFATPGYCRTATCAPVLNSVLELRRRQPNRASYVHVEIYKDPRNQVVADEVTRWNLLSEPWVFLVDSRGVVADRYEGIVTPDELDEALRQVS